MHSHQVLTSGLRRCASASASTNRASSATMGLNRRRLSGDEHALPHAPLSKDSFTRLWKPSKGINFRPQAGATTWHPAHGIVFSESKLLMPAGPQEKEDISDRGSPTPSAPRSSLHRRASRARLQSRPPAESIVSSSTAMSPPLYTGSVRCTTGGGKGSLKEVAYRSTAIKSATPNIPSALVARTSGSYAQQRANVSSINGPGIAFSRQKESEVVEERMFRNLGKSKAWGSDLPFEIGFGIDITKSVGDKFGEVPPLVFRYPSSEQENTSQSMVPVTKAVRLGRTKKKPKIHDRRQAVSDRLWQQYHTFGNVFRESTEAWSALRMSQAEAYVWARSERAKAQLALIGTQIFLLEYEFKLFAYQFRNYRSLRDSLDFYNSMDIGQRYLLLRRIRSDMITSPFFNCTEGNMLLIKQLRVFLETLEVNGQNIPDHVKSPVYEKLHAFLPQISLNGTDKYYIYRLLFNPQVSEHVHIAAVLVSKVNGLMAGVLYDLTCLRDKVFGSQKSVNSHPAYNRRAELYDSWRKRAAKIATKLKNSSYQYEEAIVRCTSNRIPAVDRPLFVKADMSRVVPDQAWLSQAGQDATNIAVPSLSTLNPSNTANMTEHPRTLSASLNTSKTPSNATTTRDFSCLAKMHTPEGCTSRGSSHLNFAPNKVLHYSQRRYECQQRTSVISKTLDPIERKLESEDQAFDEQPIGSLLYQIPEAKLKEAMLSSRSTTAAYWRYSLYEHPTKGKVKVHYCKSKETTERTAQLFLGKEVVGFDIEWKPQAQATDGLKKNVSLIQLASEERIALFHVARYPKGETVDDFVAPTLKSIMEDPNISKVGVSIKSDCTRLRKFMGIESRGLFELSHLYKLVKYSLGSVKNIDKRLVSLARQVEEHLQLPLWKGDVRSSDWSTDLNYQQMQYAASDSYAGLQLFNTMESKRKALDPSPPRPEHAELNLPIRLATGQTVEAYEEPEEAAEKPTSDEAEDPRGEPLPAPSIEEMAREFLDIAIEDGDARKPSATATKPPEVLTADAWVAEYRTSRPADARTKATAAFLRAYSLWHHQEVEVGDAARLLRDPPLQVSTVCCYILEAVRIDKLPFEVERLRQVLRQVEGTGGGRYAGLRKMVE